MIYFYGSRYINYIDPITGKDIRDLGYKIIKVSHDFRILKSGQVATFKMTNFKIEVGDIVIIGLPGYGGFWEVTKINQGKVDLDGENETLVDLPSCYIKGKFTGIEKL
jgi:hypothetical protein